MKNRTASQIENLIGYNFNDRILLQKSLTHSSSVDNRLQSNERLEFFGDAILSAVICEMLFSRFPEKLEGELTKMKSMLVSRRICARVIMKLGLHQIIKVGKGMNDSQALTGSVAAGALEAVIAAIYLDGGLKAARKFIISNFSRYVDKAEIHEARGDFKSILQQYAQQKLAATPVYEMLDEKGPDHNKCFEAEVIIDDRHFPSAWGTNKKEAEQHAAINALSALGLLGKKIEQ